MKNQIQKGAEILKKYGFQRRKIHVFYFSIEPLKAMASEHDIPFEDAILHMINLYFYLPGRKSKLQIDILAPGLQRTVVDANICNEHVGKIEAEANEAGVSFEDLSMLVVHAAISEAANLLLGQQ